jgi:hypothetical protein
MQQLLAFDAVNERIKVRLNASGRANALLERRRRTADLPEAKNAGRPGQFVSTGQELIQCGR